MRIASWNVNSIRTRLEQLGAWAARAQPDVLCLQETKVEDERFPVEALGEAGYKPVFFGEKSYNGVALATRFGTTVDDVKKNLDGDEETSQRRVIAGTVDGVRVICVYAVNGQEVGSPAWDQKLAWYERLLRELETHYSPDQELIVCGDFNVAPESIDVHDPKAWERSVLYHPDARRALEALLGWGLVDAMRIHNHEPGLYSWWDYRAGNYRKNKGLRIDLALVTKSLAARVTGVTIDKRPRELNRPSDHAPVIVELA